MKNSAKEVLFWCHIVVWVIGFWSLVAGDHAQAQDMKKANRWNMIASIAE